MTTYLIVTAFFWLLFFNWKLNRIEDRIKDIAHHIENDDKTP